MKKTHFIAIGGAIMHQLALALQRQGHTVTGSDDEINNPARANLSAAGILPAANGWFPEKITGDIDAVVLGMHAKADNPELKAAQELGISIYSFPQYVYEVSKNKKRVVVAGSHGKNHYHIHDYACASRPGTGFRLPGWAKVAGFEQSVKLSNAPVIILEGDEYPASVIEKRPKIFFLPPSYQCTEWYRLGPYQCFSYL